MLKLQYVLHVCKSLLKAPIRVVADFLLSPGFQKLNTLQFFEDRIGVLFGFFFVSVAEAVP